MNERFRSMDGQDTAGLPPEAKAWLEEHPEVAPAGLEDAWRLAGMARPYTPAVDPDPARFEAVRARVAAAVRENAPVRVDRPPHQFHLTRLFWFAAASVVVLVGAGLGWWMRPVVLQAPYGERFAATLPDGSQVELNSGGRLQYRRTFGWRTRHVDLRGEAFFDVARSEVPFTVSTFNSAVTVLGTRFSVRAWPDDDQPETIVVLEEGAVRFAARAGDDADGAAVVLQPGQMSRVPGGAAEPTEPVPVAVEERLAWRAGGMVFVDQPIGAILNELERRFGLRVETRPASIRGVRLSLVTDHAGSAEEVLAMIAGTRGYTFRPVEGGYLLTTP